jgi:hypothetical protein
LANVMSGEYVERRIDGKPCVTSMRTCGVRNGGMREPRWYMLDLLFHVNALVESGIGGWRTEGKTQCLRRRLYFWVGHQATGLADFVEFAWCWRSWPSLDRGLVCRDPSSFQGSTVAIVCRPTGLCPSYPSPSAAPGLLAISAYIRFFKDIFIESPQSTL